MRNSRFPLLLIVGLIALLGLATVCSAEPVSRPTGDATAAALKKLEDSAGDIKVQADSAWMLTSSALVMLMLPGLALFYGGMVRSKNILATMMHSMIALAVVGCFWIAFGYALAFGEPWLKTPGGYGLLGWSNKLVFLHGVGPKDVLPGTNIPIYLHAMFQGMFAIITPALISGAVAERIRFKPYCIFLVLWAALVYCPLAHWVWAMDWWTGAADAGTKPVGWLGAMGALDFAGGTVVHIAAGLSSLAAILLLRKRLGYPQHAIRPNSMVLTLLGAGLLWFGWFGFNGGSALASGPLASSAFAATQAAAAAAGLSWLVAEWLHRGKPTALGLASGIVAGLVAVTPASGFVYPWGGLCIGLIAGVVCYVSVCLKPRFGYDDSLDAFGVHGVGGFLGAVLTGVFCYKAVNDAGADGWIASGGHFGQVVTQLIAGLASIGFAFCGSLVLVKIVDLGYGFVTEPHAETAGLDRTEHGEVGFDLEPAVDMERSVAVSEPRPAEVPPNGVKRFSAVVEGANTDKLTHVWSELCQPGAKPPAEEFRAIYPYVTTVQGNVFRFRGGDPNEMRDNLERLFRKQLVTLPIRVHVEA